MSTNPPQHKEPQETVFGYFGGLVFAIAMSAFIFGLLPFLSPVPPPLNETAVSYSDIRIENFFIELSSSECDKEITVGVRNRSAWLESTNDHRLLIRVSDGDWVEVGSDAYDEFVCGGAS